MTHTVLVDRMTISQLRDAITEHGGTPPDPASRKQLRDILTGMIEAEGAETPQDSEQAAPDPVAAETPDGPDAPADAPADPEPAAAPEPEEPEAEPPITGEVVEDEVGQVLALREQTPAVMSALPTVAEFNASMALADRIARTSFVPESYRGRPDDVLAAVLFGREIGLGPMMALRDIHMIDGRPALAAHRQLGLLRQGGVEILESSNNDTPEEQQQTARITARRRDTGETMTVLYTYTEAEMVRDKKGNRLVDKMNWKSYPADMLWARAVGRLTRRLGPDMIGGLPPYVAEEVADFSDWEVGYDDTGSARFSKPQPEPDPLRQEFPDYNWPKSWAELMERWSVSIGEDAAKEWVRQMVEALTGKTTLQQSPAPVRQRMFKQASGALARFDTATVGDPMFDPNIRANVAKAFAPSVGGTLLDGPPWALTPGEAEEGTRPDHDAWVAEQTAPADGEASDGSEQSQTWGGLTAEEAAEAEAIQFGGEGYGG